MSEFLKVNLGAGYWKQEGWVTVDLDSATMPDHNIDLTQGLPFENDSVEFLVCEDTLDQLEFDDAFGLLKECRRVLVPGGVLRIGLPDLDLLIDLYREDPDKLVQLWTQGVRVPLTTGTAGEVLNRAMRKPDVGHAYVYDRKTLQTVLESCGFKSQEVTYGQSDHGALAGIDLRPPGDSLSMYFECHPA